MYVRVFNLSLQENISRIIKNAEDNISERVWVAGDTSTKKTKLLRVHKKGDKQWPTFGGYTIITENGLTRDLHQRAVRLHPINFVKKRKRKLKV